MIYRSRAAGFFTDIVSGRIGMTPVGRITTAVAGMLAVLVVVTGAKAESSAYDLNTMLNEPHPFAQVPTALPPLAPQTQVPAMAYTPYPAAVPYSQPVAAPVTKPVRDDTLIALFGFNEGPESSPTQVANSSTAVAPQIAAAGPPSAKTGDPSFITIGGGWFDFNDNEKATELRAEWRGRKLFWAFKPFVGAIGTTDSAIYGYAGFLTDIFFGRRIVVTPSLAAGLYEDGDGKDLGSVIEFRSGLEISWRFDNRSRLSALVYHISNASIDDNNPGTEVFSIGYSFPLD